MTRLRVDVVSIFPEYLAPTRLSLLGRAQDDGLLEVVTHDLRTWATDRHHTVDDTPYGGGPGMVMRPDVWGDALDEVLAGGSASPTLVVPTPAGHRFDQALAAQLAERPWLVFACGRYEGIDQRVVDHYAQRLDVVEVSIGDYVLGGGESAALVIIEAVARLLPGFVGNPASILEESHAAAAPDTLLDHPVYTRPPTWRGLSVPDVLLSGDHGEIASWRRRAALARTSQRRPDLVHASRGLDVTDLGGAAELRLATPADAPELLVLQRCCWVEEARANPGLTIAAHEETLADVAADLQIWTTFVVRVAGRLVGSVRGRLAGDGTWDIGRLMVAPDLDRRGLGRWLLGYAEAAAPEGATSCRVHTGAGSERNLRIYRKAGYRPTPDDVEPGTVALRKPLRSTRRAADFG